MASIKLLKSKDYDIEIPAFYISGKFSFPTHEKAFISKKMEKIKDSEFKKVEIITEENEKKYSLKSGLIGGALTGGIGLLAGFMLPKNKNTVVFKAILNNGKEFIGQTDKKTLNKILTKSNLLEWQKD